MVGAAKLTKNMKMEDNDGGCLDPERLLYHSGVKKSIGVPNASSPRRMKSLCKGDLDSLTMENTYRSFSVDTCDCDNDDTDHVWENEIYAQETGSTDDVSFLSHVMGGENSSADLKTLVIRLNKRLQKSDAKLAREKARRMSRERNMAKMARELLSSKAIIRRQEQQIEEMKEELKEKALVEQELCEARKVYDRRIHIINEAHAKQCDLLCREVVEANRENKVLREKADIVFQNKVTAVEIAGKPESRNDESSKIKIKGIFNILAFVYAIYAILFSSGKTPAQRYRLRSRPSITLSAGSTQSFNRSTQIGLPNGTSFRPVHFAADTRETNQTPLQSKHLFSPGESSSATTRPFRARAKHAGMKLKRAVIADDSERSRHIPFKNAFLASKQVYEAEELPINEVKSTRGGWFGSLREGVKSFI